MGGFFFIVFPHLSSFWCLGRLCFMIVAFPGYLYLRSRNGAFTDHEIFSTVILSLPLIQEGQLSVSGERMCTILVNGLED